MMRRWPLGIAFVLTLSTAAHADETGVEAGLRSGYAIPLGNAGDGDFNEIISGAIPLWFDLGYRFDPRWMIGAYFQYGFGFTGDTYGRVCDDTENLPGSPDVSCSAHNMRLGAQVHYHFRPWEDVDPWLGAGFGYEWITASASAADQDMSFTFKGFEIFNVQGGVDFPTSDDSNFALGPFLALSVANISSMSCELPSAVPVNIDCDGDVDSSTHEWLTLGVRGTFVP